MRNKGGQKLCVDQRIGKQAQGWDEYHGNSSDPGQKRRNVIYLGFEIVNNVHQKFRAWTEDATARRQHLQSERFAALGQLQLSLEGINLPPPTEDGLLLGRKIDRHGALQDGQFQVDVPKPRKIGRDSPRHNIAHLCAPTALYSHRPDYTPLWSLHSMILNMMNSTSLHDLGSLKSTLERRTGQNDHMENSRMWDVIYTQGVQSSYRVHTS